MIFNILSTTAVAATLMAAPAFAQPATLTTAVMKQIATRDASGYVVTTLAPVVRATPGDQLVYVLTYKNGASKAATGVVITNPIPSDVEYMGAGDGPSPLVSTDNRQFASPSASAAPADVVAVRWVLADAVPPGGEARMTFRAKLK